MGDLGAAGARPLCSMASSRTPYRRDATDHGLTRDGGTDHRLDERLRAVNPREVAASRAAAEWHRTPWLTSCREFGRQPAGRRGGVGMRAPAAGSEWHRFATIVRAAGSALPMREPARGRAAGELLLLDFGAQVDGYCADLTRTVVVGARADDRQRTVHELVQTAQRRAIEHLRPGMPAREGDALARDVIASRGFGDAFGHSLGHGLGLEVHEAPRLAPTSETPLPMHAVVTVEPGVYFPAWGGVRLEDDVYLGPDATERLSDGKTELLELV